MGTFIDLGGMAGKSLANLNYAPRAGSSVCAALVHRRKSELGSVGFFRSHRPLKHHTPHGHTTASRQPFHAGSVASFNAQRFETTWSHAARRDERSRAGN